MAGGRGWVVRTPEVEEGRERRDLEDITAAVSDGDDEGWHTVCITELLSELGESRHRVRVQVGIRGRWSEWECRCILNVVNSD